MAMTGNDFSKRAVVLIIDHLETVAPLGHTADAKSVDDAAAALASAAKLYDIPVVVSGVALNGAPKLTPALQKALGDVQILPRQGADCFENEAIRTAIEATGRRTLLIAGIITEIAVERAALDGKERGYDTHVVLDACNGYSERSESATVHRLSDEGVRLSSVPSVIGELATDFTDARTGQLFGLFAQLQPEPVGV